MSINQIGMQAVVPTRQRQKKKEFFNPFVWVFLAVAGVLVIGYAVFIFYSRFDSLGVNSSIANFFAGLLGSLIQ